jgi:hypothetical protein
LPACTVNAGRGDRRDFRRVFGIALGWPFPNADETTGDATPAPMRFFAFKDPEQQTKDQIEMVRSHPWISKDVPVRGFIFDVHTGRLREVPARAEAAS